MEDQVRNATEAQEQTQEVLEANQQEQTQEPEKDQQPETIDIKAHNAQMARMRTEADEYKAQIKELTDLINSKDKSAEELQARVKQMEEENAKADEQRKASELKLAVENALTKAGCRDTVSALAHIDLEGVTYDQKHGVEGLDVEALKEKTPWLFNQPRTTQVGSKQSTGDGLDPYLAALNEGLNLKSKE